MFIQGDHVVCVNVDNIPSFAYVNRALDNLKLGGTYTIERCQDQLTIGAPKVQIQGYPDLWFLESRFMLAVDNSSPFTQWENKVC